MGYELVEVRTGELGLKPLHRFGGQGPEGTVDAVKREIRDTLQKMGGEDGVRRRANAERVMEEIRHSWDEGGVCREALMEFLGSI